MLVKSQLNDVALIRYGEHQVGTCDVFDSLKHNPKLVSDCAILCAEIYSRYAKLSVSRELPPKHFSWQQFEYKIPRPPNGVIVVGGLGLEIWTSSVADPGPIAALIFRGTRFTKFADWFSNLRWFTKFIPRVWDQYKQTHALVPDVISALRSKFGNELKIVAAGHSLGGGLAQHAGYSSPHISSVYAFNPSPVTGFYSISKNIREKSAEHLRILRIYEHGEILAYLRLILRPFYPLSYQRPSILEIRFNFSSGDAITEHGIAKFAHGLHAINRQS